MGAVALAALSALIWGVGDYCGGRASGHLAALRVTAIVQLIGLPIAVVGAFLLGGVPGFGDLTWGAVAGAAGFAGIVLLYKGLSSGAMSVVAPTTSVAAAVVPVILGLLGGEHPGTAALIGVGCALVGVALVSIAGTGTARATPRLLGIALASGIAFGVFFTALDQADPAAGMWPLASARTAGAVLGAIVLVVLARRTTGPGSLRPVRWLLLGAGTFDTLANITYVLALHSGLLVVVAPVASLYPASTVLLAFALDRERMRPVQITGLCFAGAALVLTSLG